LGNVQLGTNAIFDLPPGSYFWAVQAVDSAWAGGPFAQGGSFVVGASVEIHITIIGGDVRLDWTGVGILQSADSVTGPWTDVIGASNPYLTVAGGQGMFYRIMKP
jgi:hypothetical protein